MTTYYARLATDDDLVDLLALRTEAEQWMNAAGIEQWVPIHHDHGRDLMRSAVEADQAWVIEDPDGAVVATVSLKAPDLDFWGPEDHPEAGFHVYKMIVRRRESGQDLGGAILNWAGEKAVNQGKRWVRLDCRRDNTGLHAYYQAHKFDLVRIMDEPRNPERVSFSGALFQRPAETTTPTPHEVRDRATTEDN